MMIERVPPEGYKTAPMDQRNRNPYPESIMVMYATSEHTWMQSSCSTCWVDNDTVQFAVPESYQFPNDKPEQASPVDTFMAPNGRTSANEQRFMDDDHPAAPKTCTINLNQQAMLFDWCREHKDDERTFEELAVQAIMDLMFPVTRAVLKNHWAAVNGKRRVKVTGGTLIGRIEALEATVASMRHHFNVAGLLTRPLPTAPENRDVNANTPQEES